MIKLMGYDMILFDFIHKIQCVPLATEPGISLITPKKILQRNFNRNTFVV